MSERFSSLGDDDALPHILKALDQTPQRTPAWWARRSNRLSGSKLSQLLFIQNADQFAAYREEVLGLRPRPPLDERGKANVKWGVENEPNAMATVVHHMEQLRVWDVGFEQHPTHDWFGSSPDGVVHWPGKGYGALEIKCSTKRNAKGVSVRQLLRQYSIRPLRPYQIDARRQINGQRQTGRAPAPAAQAGWRGATMGAAM